MEKCVSNKEWLEENYVAKYSHFEVPAFGDIPKDQVLICIIEDENSTFVGPAYSQCKFDEINHPNDLRTKVWYQVKYSSLKELLEEVSRYQ